MAPSHFPVRPLLTALLLLSIASGTGAADGQRPIAAATALNAELDKLVTAVEPEMLSWRRYLHQRPELSNREVETAKYIVERLKSFGLEPRTGVAKNGVVAVLKGGLPGPVIGLR